MGNKLRQNGTGGLAKTITGPARKANLVRKTGDVADRSHVYMVSFPDAGFVIAIDTWYREEDKASLVATNARQYGTIGAAATVKVTKAGQSGYMVPIPAVVVDEMGWEEGDPALLSTADDIRMFVLKQKGSDINTEGIKAIIGNAKSIIEERTEDGDEYPDRVGEFTRDLATDEVVKYVADDGRWVRISQRPDDGYSVKAKADDEDPRHVAANGELVYVKAPFGNLDDAVAAAVTTIEDGHLKPLPDWDATYSIYITSTSGRTDLMLYVDQTQVVRDEPSFDFNDIEDDIKEVVDLRRSKHCGTLRVDTNHGLWSFEGDGEHHSDVDGHLA